MRERKVSDRQVSAKEPTGYVYFMTLECDENPYNAALYMKIGYARDPEARRSTLKTALPFDIQIDAAYRGTQAEERRLHRKLAAIRVRREWFRLGKRLQKFVDDLADAYLMIRIEGGDLDYEPTLRECLTYRSPSKRFEAFLDSARETSLATGKPVTISNRINIRWLPLESDLFASPAQSR